MIRLFDGRDKDFELVGTLEKICDYMGFNMETEDIHDFYDLEERIKKDNDGMNFYHVEVIND